MRKKILVVDDDPSVHEILGLRLRGFAEVVSAFSIREAERMLPRSQEFDVVCMDGNIPPEGFTGPFIKKLRLAYNGPIIAISSHAESRIEMLSLGCSYECAKGPHLPAFIREVLGL